MFVEWMQRNRLVDNITDTQSYHPYPKACEREKWESIPEEVAQAA